MLEEVHLNAANFAGTVSINLHLCLQFPDPRFPFPLFNHIIVF